MVYHHHPCLRVERDDLLSASCFLCPCAECRRQIKTVSIRHNGGTYRSQHKQNIESRLECRYGKGRGNAPAANSAKI